MSHVDDGTLHAYLDGELAPPEVQGVETHLTQCAGCRTRLEEERVLITRAAELLGRAAPRDRALPPFPAGDVRPPVRLWWQVRLPLAWAATVALALAIGMYLGPTVGRGPIPAARADSEQPVELMPQTAPLTGELAQGAPRANRLGAAKVSSPEPPRVPSPAVQADRLERSQAQAPPPAASAPVEAQDEAAVEHANARVAMKSAPRSYALKGSPIGADSARLVLGTDPLVVPDLPVRGMYQARLIGYSAVVVVEQTLDSSTVIEVINGRPAPLALPEVVVTGPGVVQADSASAGARALLGRSADSAPAGNMRKRAALARPTAAPGVDQSVPGLLLEVRGPLSADSLAALRRRLRPLRP
jgi:hypothetical protein